MSWPDTPFSPFPSECLTVPQPGPNLGWRPSDKGTTYYSIRRSLSLWGSSPQGVSTRLYLPACHPRGPARIAQCLPWSHSAPPTGGPLHMMAQPADRGFVILVIIPLNPDWKFSIPYRARCPSVPVQPRFSINREACWQKSLRQIMKLWVRRRASSSMQCNVYCGV